MIQLFLKSPEADSGTERRGNCMAVPQGSFSAQNLLQKEARDIISSITKSWDRGVFMGKAGGGVGTCQATGYKVLQ